MPDRTISILGSTCGALTLLYIGLVVVTVYFATWQTDLALRMRTTEAAISTLESDYYASITQLDSMDPHAIGYVTPTHVEYAVMVPTQALTLLDR